MAGDASVALLLNVVDVNDGESVVVISGDMLQRRI